MMSYRPGAIDLRSDQLTKPTPEMREAMATAEVGNDIYGEDPTVNALEEHVASLLGKEAAMFVPSGTMANQIAIGLHTRPGESVLVEESAHCFLLESGAGAALNGIQYEVVAAGRLADESAWQIVRPDSYVHATTTLVVAENTYNVGAGRSLSRSDTDRVARLACERGMSLHIDGARLWNAAVALETTEADLAAPASTVAVCLSKSLGAPVGSVLAGPKAMMPRARKLKKRFGGAMCQAGIVAAGALYALQQDYRHMLQEDRRRLVSLAETLRDLQAKGASLDIDCPEPHSNILFFRHTQKAGDVLAEQLADAGVLMHHMGDGWLRIVTHRDISDADIDKTNEILRKVLSA